MCRSIDLLRPTTEGRDSSVTLGMAAYSLGNTAIFKGMFNRWEIVEGWPAGHAHCKKCSHVSLSSMLVLMGFTAAPVIIYLLLLYLN